MPNTIGNTIKELINAPDYNEVRKNVNDKIIDFVCLHMHSDYKLFEEKEIKYQAGLNAITPTLDDAIEILNQWLRFSSGHDMSAPVQETEKFISNYKNQ